MNDYIFSAIVMAAALCGGAVCYFAGLFIIRKFGRSMTLWGSTVKVELLEAPLHYLIPVLFLSASIPFTRLSQKAVLYLNHITAVSLIGLTGWLAFKVVQAARDAFLSRYDISVSDNMYARSMHTQIRLLANILGAAVVAVTAAAALMTFAEVRSLGVSILASAGIVGIVIGFAAQKTLGNLIAGIQIAVSQPIRIDDVVVIENEWGRIEKITLSYVVVRIWDLRRLVVPISYFLEKPFQNWTRVSAEVLGSVFIYADYTAPVKEIRGELTRILNSSSKWDKKVNVLQVTDITEKTVELRALMSAADSPSAWDLRCEVREKLLEFLQKNYPLCLPKTRVEIGGSAENLRKT